MALYNQRLLEVCRSRDIDCIDLASFVARDTTTFYDDCHFNEAGAEKVADIIASHILTLPPFTPSHVVKQ
jgi:hypothetical protein